MTTSKFKGKFRTTSARWKQWDYGSNAAYFITICTHNRQHWFGAIRDGEMYHTPLGLAATDCWYAIVDHFPFVELGAFVVMPNHMHGIIIINHVETQNLASPKRKAEDLASPKRKAEDLVPPKQKAGDLVSPKQKAGDLASPKRKAGDLASPKRKAGDLASPKRKAGDLASPKRKAQDFAPLQGMGNRFGPQSKNLASIVRGYKIGVTKYARRHAFPFRWQARYWDRVIRDEGEHQRIRYYIETNVANWRKDSMRGTHPTP